MDILLVLTVASLLCFAAMIISDKKRGLAFFSVVLSVCGICCGVNNMDTLGDDFLLLVVPLLFIAMASTIAFIRVGTE